MQPLYHETNLSNEDLECASTVIETILLGMRTLKSGMRNSRPSYLSVPQFRVLAFVKHHEGASLSDAAEHIGLTLPSMSKAVDAMVKRGLIERKTSEEDRRRMTLALTEAGLEVFQTTTDATRARIAGLLGELTPDQCSEVMNAANTLKSLLSNKIEEPEK